MATKIIDPTGDAHHSYGVTVKKTCWWCDEYRGTAEALIASGIITADQLPGQPEGPKVAATYYAGVLRSPRENVPRDEHYLNIHRAKNGKKIRVLVGLTKEESARRDAEQDARAAAKKEGRIAATVDQNREFRLLGKRLAWALWGLASMESRDDAWHQSNPGFNIELSEDGVRKLGEAVNKIWSIFDQDSLREVTPMRTAAIAAAADKKFQDFLVTQCIRTEGVTDRM
jgi:hypothetical protein